MEKTIIVKAEDFRYPTKEEIEAAGEKYPELGNLGFEEKNDIEMILEKGNSFYKTNKEVNLFWWDVSLLNKLGKLNRSYINTSVNYERYLHSIENGLKNEYIHIIQFNFYAETAYYFLISARDIIYQIVNIYFDLKMQEYDVNTKRILQTLNNKKVKKLIVNLENDLKVASNIRNSFTHRFPKNQKDYRMIYIKNDNSEELSIGSGRELKPEEIIKNIDNSLQVFSCFINELRILMNVEQSQIN